MGVRIKLFSMEGGRHLVATSVTNGDGRTEEPLLDGETWRAGTYEIEFLVGEYFGNMGVESGDPPFLDEVVVRFSLAGDGS
ncbi:MAG: hydroxyisourate hydrolase, partial [Woeseiaceae bacterium]